MASRGQGLTVTYTAFDASTGLRKTGDAANITPRWIKDGVSAALTTPTVTEVDATNAPGEYKSVLSGTECTCDFGTLTGKSTTSSIEIVPVHIVFEQLPVAAAQAAGGLITSAAGSLDLDEMNVDIEAIQTAIGTAGAGLTALGDSRIANLDMALSALMTTAMTESYPADGATMSMAQFAYLIRSFLTDFGISGVTITAHKIDGTTTSSTYTMNDATTPTSLTRAS